MAEGQGQQQNRESEFEDPHGAALPGLDLGPGLTFLVHPRLSNSFFAPGCFES